MTARPPPGVRVHIVLPKLAELLLNRQVTRQALSSRKVFELGLGRRLLRPGIGRKIFSPGFGAQRYARQNESWCEDLPHAECPT